MTTAWRDAKQQGNQTMCFSPTASFVAAGLTGTCGVIALSRANSPREWPLAAVPLLFSFQQSIEGSLWLSLESNPNGAMASALPLAFLIFAEVFWPAYVPTTIFLTEPNAKHRHLMLVCLAVGLAVSTYLLWWILTHEHRAAIIDDHIVYFTEARHSDGLGLAYLAATGLPGMLSSRRSILTVGSITLVGSLVAYLFYWEAFVSVWCFFAAAASVMIVLHFEWARSLRLDRQLAD
jgi:hypothetical protein